MSKKDGQVQEMKYLECMLSGAQLVLLDLNINPQWILFKKLTCEICL